MYKMTNMGDIAGKKKATGYGQKRLIGRLLEFYPSSAWQGPLERSLTLNLLGCINKIKVTLDAIKLYVAI